MVTTHKISVDLLQTAGRYSPPIEVMQDDQYSRDIQITITQGDQTPSLSGNTVQIYFSKPDGTGGAYDKLPDGTAAYTISSNMITIKLAPQVCTVPGDVKISVALISGNIKLNTFAIDLKVHKKPGLQATSGNYFKIAGSVAEEELQPITDAIRNLEDVAFKSVRFTNQTLTDDQKSQARNNIGAGSKAVVDSLSARLANGSVTLEDRDGNAETLFLEQDNLYMTVRDKVETVLTTGYQYLTEEQKAQARANIGAIGADENGIVKVSELQISDETEEMGFLAIPHEYEDGYAVAVLEGVQGSEYVRIRGIAPGSEDTDAVNLGQLNEMVGGKKVYELISSVTLEEDDLKGRVTFIEDGNGNPFELTDFIIKVNAGFVDGTQSTLYMNVNGNAVIVNGSVPSISTGLRGFNIYFREEPDGFKRVEYTNSMIGTNIYNAQANIARTQLIPPMAGVANLPITSIALFLGNGATNEFVVGSTFELWGVRA